MPKHLSTKISETVITIFGLGGFGATLSFLLISAAGWRPITIFYIIAIIVICACLIISSWTNNEEFY